MGQILLVDDDVDTTSAYATALRLSGFVADVAHTCEEALEQMFARHYELIVLDYRLPDGSGLDLLRRTTPSRRGAITVIVTGYGGVEMTVQAMRLGVHDVLVKPVYCDQLVEVASSLLIHSDGSSHQMHTPSPAFTRWATLLIDAASAPCDLRTIAQWSRFVGRSPGTVKSWCRTAGVSARSSLLLARLLRVSLLPKHVPVRLQDVLDVMDARTVRKIMKAIGAATPDEVDHCLSSWMVVLSRQTLIRDDRAVATLDALLRKRHNLGP